MKHRLNRWYSGSSTLNLLSHLYETYALISNVDWLANDKCFREVYAPTDPIEVVWQEIYALLHQASG